MPTACGAKTVGANDAFADHANLLNRDLFIDKAMGDALIILVTVLAGKVVFMGAKRTGELLDLVNRIKKPGQASRLKKGG